MENAVHAQAHQRKNSNRCNFAYKAHNSVTKQAVSSSCVVTDKYRASPPASIAAQVLLFAQRLSLTCLTKFYTISNGFVFTMAIITTAISKATTGSQGWRWRSELCAT